MIALGVFILISAIFGMWILDESFIKSLCIVLFFAAIAGMLYLFSCAFGALIL